MNITKQDNELPKNKDKLRNFDLTVDEIKLMKSIDEMENTIARIEGLDTKSPRIKYLRLELTKLEDRLEELRDNTLIG